MPHLRYLWALLAAAVAGVALRMSPGSAGVVLSLVLLGSSVLLVVMVAILLSFSSRRRVVHELEHATAAVIEQRGFVVPRGSSAPGWFTLDIPNEVCDLEAVRSAVHDAIARVRGGETSLVCSRACGTVSIVRAMLASLVLCGAGVIAQAVDVPAGPILAAAILLAYAAAASGSSIGMFVQRRLTVSARFTEATVLDVSWQLYQYQRRYTVALRVRCHA